MEEKNWLEKFEVESCVGKNSGYYLGKWGEYRTQKVKGINFAAFFFSSQWLGYRKLYNLFIISYMFAALVYILTFGFFLLYEYGYIPFQIAPYPFYSFLGAKLLLGIYFSAFGNFEYRKKVLSWTQEYAKFDDRGKYINRLKNIGGTNTVLPLVSAFIDLLVLLSLYASMYEAMNYRVEFINI